VGGLDPRTFSTGSVEDLRAQIAAALSETGGWRLILAPAGALPPDAQPDLLAAMSGIVHEL
jgi:uroporphyrinogen-III decarboxylase